MCGAPEDVRQLGEKKTLRPWRERTTSILTDRADRFLSRIAANFLQTAHGGESRKYYSKTEGYVKSQVTGGQLMCQFQRRLTISGEKNRPLPPSRVGGENMLRQQLRPAWWRPRREADSRKCSRLRVGRELTPFLNNSRKNRSSSDICHGQSFFRYSPSGLSGLFALPNLPNPDESP